MANFRDKFAGKFIKVDDLRGQRRTVTIDRVAEETLGQGADAEDKLVVYFREKDTKGLVLNRVNSESIAELAGDDDTDSWGGTRIELYPSRTEYQGKRVPCIRIDTPSQSSAVQRTAPAARFTEELSAHEDV